MFNSIATKISDFITSFRTYCPYKALGDEAHKCEGVTLYLHFESMESAALSALILMLGFVIFSRLDDGEDWCAVLGISLTVVLFIVGGVRCTNI